MFTLDIYNRDEGNDEKFWVDYRMRAEKKTKMEVKALKESVDERQLNAELKPQIVRRLVRHL